MRAFRAAVLAAISLLLVIAAPAGAQTASADWQQGLRGLDQTGLNARGLALLGRNGFVLRPTGLADIDDIYDRAQKDGDCVFVTTDAMLHAGHVFFDDMLRVVEIDRLAGLAQGLTDRMLAASKVQYEAAKTPEVKEAARLNIGFFAVAKAQFVPGYRPGLGLDKMVAAEIANIDAHDKVAFRELLPYVAPHSRDDTPYAYEDYTQYAPRGHYTRNETFQRYFKAMMWFGRIDFKLLGGKEGSKKAAYGRRMTLQALLITDALGQDPAALKEWHRIYDPTVFFVGKTDDLTVEDYLKLSAATFPGTGVDRFTDRTALAAFMEKARDLHPPKILGGPGGGAADNMGFRFMGQRFIPDSHIFQELVFGAAGAPGEGAPDFHFNGAGKPFTMEDIPDYGEARAFPRGLDVMAVLGSARALAILTAEGDTAYVDYAKQFDMLAGIYRTTTEAEWTQNLYWRWLQALLPLLTPPAKPVQDFLASPAWLDKQLVTALGSWAELRHDTILYAKQSYTGIAKSMVPREPDYAYGYVEPAPEVYARLTAMIDALKASLDDLGLMPPGMEGKFGEFSSLLHRLEAMSNLELDRLPLTRADYDLLNNFGDFYASLTRFPPEVTARISSGADSRMDVVADVHTYVQGGLALEEGVGAPALIYVRIRDDKGYRLCRGGVFSYAEFKWPMADRLTDEKWQKMGKDGTRPAAPGWARALAQ